MKNIKIILILIILIIVTYSTYYFIMKKGNNNNVINATENNTIILNETNKDEKVVKEEHNIEVIDGVTYIDGILIVNKTYSLPSDYGDGLTKETLDAFYEMQGAAKLDGLNLFIKSGFRRYIDQKIIYNRYVESDGKDAADTYSARPGHSEHQSGLAFDLNIVNDSFETTPEGIWVNKNAYKYGFVIRFPKGKEDKTGYKYESWHLRYVGLDLAKKLYNDGDWISLEEYFNIDSKYVEE